MDKCALTEAIALEEWICVIDCTIKPNYMYKGWFIPEIFYESETKQFCSMLYKLFVLHEKSFLKLFYGATVHIKWRYELFLHIW